MLRALSVKQFNEYFKTTIKHDPILSKVYINGELSNVRISGNHLYFSLKEANDIIDCVIYYYEDKNIDFDFKEGMDVLVKGTVNLNNYSSRLVIVTNEIAQQGISEEYQKFLKMKEDFRKLGYFDEANKKPIPTLPKNIGLITSKDGAAVVDFIAVINQIPNDINIKLHPVKVQGTTAVAEIENAITKLDGMDLDLIVLTRGGGSNEDLSVFNDRVIIESVFKAETPIISAIGHKIDSTLLDLVADLSLQTPTEAGSYVIRNYSNMMADMDKILKQMKDILKAELKVKDLRLEGICHKLRAYSPMTMISASERELQSLKKSLDQALKASLSLQESNLKLIETKLALNKNLIEVRKKNIIIKDKNNKEIFSKYSPKVGDEIEISFSDGSLRAVIIDG